MTDEELAWTEKSCHEYLLHNPMLTFGPEVLALIGEVRALRSRPAKVSTDADGVQLIAWERHRQIMEEGFDPQHDDTHVEGELRWAMYCYAIRNSSNSNPPQGWPWDVASWKPSPLEVQNLVKAGALIAAEIDRLLRLQAPPDSTFAPGDR